MKRVVVQCPYCETSQEDEDCTFATVKKVVGDKVFICCCETQAKKVKKE
jgi:hypothetical protein